MYKLTYNISINTYICAGDNIKVSTAALLQPELISLYEIGTVI